jgi:hypothetical protein
METELTYAEMKALHERKKKLNDEHAKLYSKKRLMGIVSKKIKTTMIGAVAACEQHIGHLWGHGKPPSQLTDEEKRMREVWEELRNAILNKGNTQLRAALDEIAHYTLQFERYEAQFLVKKENENDG